MAIHIICLVILFILTVFSLITGNNFITLSITEAYSFTHTLNGTVSEYDLGSITTELYLDPLLQAIVWISIIGGIAIASGITVFGSGISESSQHWLTHAIFYVALWTILSALSFTLIVSIEYIGSLIYLSLTIFYAVGVIIHIGQR